MARLLADWLPDVMNSVEPWLSKDIQKGAQWFQEIKDQLKDIRVGLVCVTSDNHSAPWIQFEAGALAQAGHVMVATVLYGIEKHAVGWPLAQFQHTVAEEKEDIRKLLRDLSEALQRNGEKTPPPRAIEANFDNVWWPLFEKRLKEVNLAAPGSPAPVRKDRELLIDILDRLQALEQRLLAIPMSRPAVDKPAEDASPKSLEKRLDTKTETVVLHEGYVQSALNLLPPHAPAGDLEFEPLRRESINQLEEALRISPGSRRIGIVLARIYVVLNDLPAAIKLLSDILDVRRQLGIPVDKDDAALFFNRGCYRNLMAKNLQDDPLTHHYSDLAWQDVMQAIAIMPEFCKIALNDPDYESLWDRLKAICPN